MSCHLSVARPCYLALLSSSLAAESRARRNLVGGAGDGGGGGSSRRRGLADDCASQMWILADTGAVEEDGFPYCEFVTRGSSPFSFSGCL